jgi:hypothetical protein
MSDPANSATATGTSGTTNPASTTTGGTPATGGTSTTGGTPATGSAPTPVMIHALTFNSDSNWPADLILDSSKGNWQEWDRRIRTIVDQRGFCAYLNGTLPCPDETLHAAAAYSWSVSDQALCAFLLEHVSDNDYKVASVHDDSASVYNNLHDINQNQGPFAKVKVIKEALSIRFSPNAPLSQTFDHISKLHARFIRMGKLTDDQWLSVFALNALGDHYPRLQTSVNDLLASPLTTSVDIRSRLVQEEQTTGSGSGISPETTLAAISSKPPRPICTHCKRTGHRTEFCIATGGAMAGKMIDEARAAQEAARNAQRPRIRANRNSSSATPNANVATVQGQLPPPNTTFTINGLSCTLVANNNSQPDTSGAFISMPSYDEEEYIAVLATTDNPHASLNWDSHTRSPFISTSPDCAYTRRAPIARINKLPFILNTGATCHISPEASNFKNLKAIPRRPVKGLCGSAIYAVGMGDIKLHIAGGIP